MTPNRLISTSRKVFHVTARTGHRWRDEEEEVETKNIENLAGGP